MTPELQAFLFDHPDLRFIDLLLHDLNGVDRGKRIDVASAPTVFADGLPLPGSLFALDVLGGTIQESGLGFDEGDADRPCRPIAGTLLEVPWQDAGVAQAQLSMYEPDGEPFFADPRHLLQRVLARFAARGLTPVVAIELEFYLLDRERDAGGLPQPPRGPLTGRREFRTQINSMLDLDEYSAVLADIDAICRAQRVPATSALAEYGPGQFEVNLAHSADALGACDEAVRFRRVVKSVARRHEMDATFMAKPYRDMAGSGLHVHVSLLDAAGSNVFASPQADGSPILQHAVAGLLATMADGMALFAPHANSWRRFQPEAYVPLTAAWSVNNRGTAVRIPASDPQNRRIEHRVAGADANVYLVMAWILAGVLHGLDAALAPPAAVTGNAYRTGARRGGDELPLHWPTAIDRFANSRHAGELFGPRFHSLYSTVKRGELAQFSSYITPVECAWYLPAL